MNKQNYLIMFLCTLVLLFGFSGAAHSVPIFYEDFDGNGPGFNSWSVWSEAPPAGSWDLFEPEAGDGENHTPGTDNYAAVRSGSNEFEDTEVTLTSPEINTNSYQKLIFSFDFSFHGIGCDYVEDGVEIWAGGTLLETIGLYADFDPGMPSLTLSGTKSYDISYAAGDPSLDVMFGFYSSMGFTSCDTIQIDNIKVDAVPVPEPATI